MKQFRATERNLVIIYPLIVCLQEPESLGQKLDIAVLTQYFNTFDNYHLYRELCRLYIEICSLCAYFMSLTFLDTFLLFSEFCTLGMLLTYAS